MKLFVYAFLILITIPIFATTKFAMCAYIDDNDKAIGFYETFATENTGNDIYIFYKQDVSINQTYKVKIERMENRIDSEYQIVDTISLKAINDTQNYCYNSYTFSLPGFYKITLLDSTATNSLATYKTSIRYLDNYYNNDSTIDTWYYKNVKMAFCDSVLSEILIGQKSKFILNEVGINIVTYVAHDEKKLRTDKIIAKIYSINNSKNLVETLTIDLKPTQRWTSFPINIKNKGKYSVELFSDKDIFIQKKSVEVE
ncbi:MAG TPA: hypothetical protein PK431_07375 [Chitinophagales bacterium]|nr:hypothetical protein [Chitinophagales bacterium]